jgi:hypothetical protein
MRLRCFNPKCKSYSYYGGRGITICDRWLGCPNGFINFLADMGKRPKGMSIDRINVDGNYEPGNCRWATSKEQASNTRATRKYKAEHATPEQDVAAITGIDSII